MDPTARQVVEVLDAIDALCSCGAFPGALGRTEQLARALAAWVAIGGSHTAHAEHVRRLSMQLRSAVEAHDAYQESSASEDLRIVLGADRRGPRSERRAPGR